MCVCGGGGRSVYVNLYFIVASILNMCVGGGGVLLMLLDLLLLLQLLLCLGSVYFNLYFIVSPILSVCVLVRSVYVNWSFIVAHILRVSGVLFMLIDILLLIMFVVCVGVCLIRVV